ncbi:MULTISPECIES: AraC family transcriptional regulator [unclassified Pseudomonas]|uniref:AraC family transcriptional regulator n=1 Tax=unclassified Pseudomonas TaxID=196821 RepID=UPI000A1FA7B2|nr:MULTISPECIES: AraC family transcriptional regulator [unclassified Pseudomonas]
MSHLIRATNLWGYDELVRELGGDPQRLLGRFHIPPANERPDDAFYLYRSASLLLEATAVELKCADFGLRLARWQGLEILGPVAVIARNSATVLEAFEAIARYLYIHSPALQLGFTRHDEAGWVQFDYRIRELSAPQLRQSYELSLANALQILKLLAGEGAHPMQVSFLHPPLGPVRGYEKVFGCEVRFEQDWCGWRMPLSLAARAIDHADAQTLHYATRYLESSYAPGTAALSLRVVELIGRLLPTGHCNIENVADGVTLHPRTLQRRLLSEGVRYEELLDRERRRLADHYLCRSGLQMVQIAGLLGYAEQSVFSRSCQRWFGTTAKKHRDRSHA